MFGAEAKKGEERPALWHKGDGRHHTSERARPLWASSALARVFLLLSEKSKEDLSRPPPPPADSDVCGGSAARQALQRCLVRRWVWPGFTQRPQWVNARGDRLCTWMNGYLENLGYHPHEKNN